jgi:hypothetical protein
LYIFLECAFLSWGQPRHQTCLTCKWLTQDNSLLLLFPPTLLFSCSCFILLNTTCEYSNFVLFQIVSFKFCTLLSLSASIQLGNNYYYWWVGCSIHTMSSNTYWLLTLLTIEWKWYLHLILFPSHSSQVFFFT